MKETILSVAALLSAFVSLGALALHCWQDKRRFRQIAEPKPDER